MKRAGRWSEVEIKKLRDFATKVSVMELTRKLGRSRGAVTAKAFELRLSVKSDETAGKRRLQPRQN